MDMDPMGINEYNGFVAQINAMPLDCVKQFCWQIIGDTPLTTPAIESEVNPWAMARALILCEWDNWGRDEETGKVTAGLQEYIDAAVTQYTEELAEALAEGGN